MRHDVSASGQLFSALFPRSQGKCSVGTKISLLTASHAVLPIFVPKLIPDIVTALLLAFAAFSNSSLPTLYYFPSIYFAFKPIT
jgi:hypothetical protein